MGNLMPDDWDALMGAARHFDVDEYTAQLKAAYDRITAEDLAFDPKSLVNRELGPHQVIEQKHVPVRWSARLKRWWGL